MKTRKLLALALALVMVFTVFAACTDNGANSGTSESTSSADEKSSSSTADEEESSVPAEDSSEPEEDSSEESEDKPEAGGTGIFPGTPGTDSITAAITQEPPDMNSITTTDTISFALLKNLYENLVRLDTEDEVGPGAAESWDISDDKLTYTFHIREGMVWENGDPVTAMDFEFAWKQLLNPENAAEYAYFLFSVVGAEDYNAGTGSIDDVKITSVDDSTLEVVLIRPTDYFLYQTSFGSLCPINQKFYEEVGADKYGTEAEYILTNGPFIAESWAHENEFVMVKNEDYYNAESIKLPKVICKVIKDTNAVMNSFQAGEIDFATLTLGSQVKQIEDMGYPTLQYDDGSSFYLQFNHENEVLSNVNIRKAVAYAIDREAFVNAVLANKSVPATSLTPPAILDNNGKPFPERLDSPWPTAGDTEIAKEYFEKGLEELGMTAEEAGKKITMIADDGDAAVKMASFFKEQLNSKLGMDIVIENMPFKSRLERTTLKDYSMVFGGWGPDYTDPNTFLDLFTTTSGNNSTNFSNEEYDKLIADAANEADADKRMEMFDRVEEIIWENVVVAPVYWRARDYVVSEKVDGIYRTAFQDMMFTLAEIN